MNNFHGILPVDKPRGITSFSLIAKLRLIFKEKTIGHTGTLDPFATGVMIVLVGRNYTKLSNQFLNQDKEYQACLYLGMSTDTFDCDGIPTATSFYIPSLEEVERAIQKFQGTILQIPPMFSAKKVNGKKLYELARAGKTIERAPVEITLKTTLISYQYPRLKLLISCSKGTYIRSIANDLGEMLQCKAHLNHLRRLRSGEFQIKDCISMDQLISSTFTLNQLYKNSDGILKYPNP